MKQYCVVVKSDLLRVVAETDDLRQAYLWAEAIVSSFSESKLYVDVWSREDTDAYNKAQAAAHCGKGTIADMNKLGQEIMVRKAR